MSKQLKKKTKRVRGKSVYVLKDENGKETSKKSEGKSVYVLKTSEEVIHKYADLIYDFLDEEGGLFLLISRDKGFLLGFKSTLHKEMFIENERIRAVSNVERALMEIEVYVEHGKKPFIFLEHMLDGQSTLGFLKHLKENYKDLHVVVLSPEVSQDQLALFHENGAENFITKPASINVLVEKIAFTIEPQCELEALIKDGKKLVEWERFEKALEASEAILEMKPGSPAGLMIMGDALKGLARRKEALKAYENASENAKFYLEPVKKMADFHAEEGNKEKLLECLLKLDELSPLNVERKVDIGELHVDMNHMDQAEEYFDKAISCANDETLGQVAEVGVQIAEILLNVKPELSEKYFRKSIAAKKGSRDITLSTAHNRLGIALRKQGKWREAIEEYMVAVDVSPHDENIRFNMAMAYMEGKEYHRALMHLRKAVEINPEFYAGNAFVSYSIGTLYQKLDKTTKALEFFRHVQEISPGYKDTQKRLKTLSG